MRNSDRTLYVKGIRITEDHYTYINKIKKKKSMAGKLKDIIDIYIEYEIKSR